MSRKRKLQLSRLDELDRRLHGLYQKGDDEAFVALAQERSADFGRCSAASRYAEVVDRALRGALAAGDLSRSERILRRLPREARSRPLALVAAAADHLAAGRTVAARQPLADLAAAGSPAPAPGAAALERLVEEVAAHAAREDGLAALAPLPGEAALVTQALAVSRFCRGLAALEGGSSPLPTAEISALGKSLDALRAACGGDRTLTDLLADAGRCLHLLGVVASAERAIRRPPRGYRAAESSGRGLESFRGLAREVGKPLLAVLRADPWPPLLRPLRHALHERWRSLLAWVAGQPDADATWSELYSISPPLFSLDLEAAPGASPEDGAPAIRRRAEARSLLSAQRFGELARWLALVAKHEAQPARLVQLWALELWAWDREEAKLEEDGAAAAPSVMQPLMSALVRLERMAAECRQRIPPGQQRQVARFLTERLVELCHGVRFCRTMAATAESLLLHLPDDPGLLVVGLAAAVCSSNPDVGDRCAARIAARGVVGGAELARALDLVSEIAIEAVPDSISILRRLRPLLPEEAWPRAVAVMVREVAGTVCSSIRGYGLDLDLRCLRRDLDLCRTSLGDSAELAALAAAVACFEPAAGATDLTLRQDLARLPGLEPALIAFRVLAEASLHGGRRLEEAFQASRKVVLDRLDGRWRLWQPVLPPLLAGASRQQRHRLRSMLVELQKRQGVDEVDRRAYGRILEDIEVLAQFERQARRELGWAARFDGSTARGSERRAGREAGRRRSARPKAAGADDDQLGLDLF